MEQRGVGYALKVTMRLLDPPLHEFLPAANDEAGVAKLASELGMPLSDVAARMAELAEVNPMLGLRGCRLGTQHETCGN
jgi:pyruvate,orthophosphate dikinase